MANHKKIIGILVASAAVATATYYVAKAIGILEEDELFNFDEEFEDTV
jgi:hypothetical protein